MATNTILTPDMITKEALRILHEKLTFLSKVNKQYDSSFAREGAKVGSALRIRKPARFVTRNGPTLDVQDFVETNTTLTVEKQLGIDVEFSSEDLTMDLDSFSKQFIEPAMAQLASEIEADALTMIYNVGKTVYNNTELVWKDTVLAKARLDQQTTPKDNNRCMLIGSLHQVSVLDDTKGLFQDSTKISQQYVEGNIGQTAGAMWAVSDLMPNYETGTAGTAGNDSVASTAAQGATTLSLTIGNNETIKRGQVFTVADCFEIHPETKKVYPTLYQFTAIADATASGAGAITVTVRDSGSDGLYTTASAVKNERARANISRLPTAADVVTFIGDANAVLPQSVTFHEDAFTFATADLVLPKGTDMASREVMEGISMRLVRDYDVQTDQFPARFDVLYGYKMLRDEYAARLVAPFQ